MGYAILMQWTLAPQPAPVPGRMGISDLVLSRILEHYNISHPMRSTVQLRTFRATFTTDADPPATSTRVLTTVTHSVPIPHARDVSISPGARDNATYLFLEDRGVPRVGGGAAGAPAVKEDSGGKEVEEGKAKEDEKEGKKEDKDDERKDGKEKKKEEKDKDDKTKLEEDGFEIVEPGKDKDKADKADKQAGDEPMVVDPPAPSAAGPPTSALAPPPPPPPRRAESSYKILAIKPATAVMPALQQLLSPFVLGWNKSARAAASTTGTAQQAAPTQLAGTPLMITTLAFPPVPHPHPAITLSVHILPNVSAQTIFLEAEWDGSACIDTSRAILREFLYGCVPLDVAGAPRFMYWEESGAPGAQTDRGQPVTLENAGWYGVEKTRRITFLLAKALRESQFI